MAFNEKLPKWDNVGVEPPESKKTEGWQPTEKPPAQWFNWMFNRNYKVMEELRNKAEEKTTIGLLTNLTTTIKTNIVNALNSVNSDLVAHKADNVHIGTNEQAKIRRTSSQSIPNNTNTVINFQSAEFDSNSLFQVSSPTRVTVLSAGKYLVIANIRWGASATGLRRIGIYRNGQFIAQDDRLPTASICEGVLTTVVDLNANDYLEVFVLQNSGGALDAIAAGAPHTPTLTVIKVG